MRIHHRRFRAILKLVIPGLVLALTLPLLARSTQAQDLPPTVDESTTAWLAQAAPNATAAFIITFHNTEAQVQADEASAIEHRPTRRARVHRLLVEQSRESATALREFVRAQGLERELRSAQSFVSTNSIAVTGGKRLIEALQRWDRVRAIELDAPVKVDPPQDGEPLASVDSVEWNISQIEADRVQTELGITGRGVVVGSLDGGVRFSHQALRANYKCAGQTDHSACWLDALYGKTTPYDQKGHGTHTTGTAVGQGGIGVAPGATWIACKSFDENGSAKSSVTLKCMDWFLAPGGNPANAPDVVINSWGNNDGASTAYMQATQNWVNAGIMPIFSNGNNGPDCNTVKSPGSYPHTVGVGATDSSDVIASFSSRGASPFDKINKPDLSAPGVQIRSAVHTSDTDYGVKNGTSMAAPHVAGLVALLLEANPKLTIEQVKATMRSTARIIASSSCGSSGIPNNVYGWGRINAYTAVKAALADNPAPTTTPTSAPTTAPTATSIAPTATQAPATATVPATTQSIQSLTLINADTEQSISGFNPMPNGATLNLATLPSRNLSIRANASPTRVGSVQFALDGQVIKTENSVPYAIAGDRNGADYLPWTPALGTHTLTVTPYSGSKAGGTAGAPLTITFTVTDGAATASPTGLPATSTPIASPTGLPATTTPTMPPVADQVFVGAGDIANCSTTEDEATAKLLDNIPGAVFLLGDNAYPDGSASDFKNCYDPTWGRHKARTYPIPGNHEYHTSGASAYYDYFGAAAGSRGKGYYSYNLGAWHIIALNSEIAANAGSEQEKWLRADLAANPTSCTLAYWHRPLFSSGDGHGNDPKMKDIWRTLYESGADVVLSGHDHNYERFALQDADGRAAPNRGIREFVVGTGGTSLRGIGTVRANSEVRNADTHGVLKLTLRAGSYAWEFVPIAGKSFRDTGNASCVSAGNAPTATPAAATATPAAGTSTATPAPATPTAAPGAGTVMTATLKVTDGYDTKAQKTLVEDGKVYVVTGSDNEWWETEAGYATIYQFRVGVPDTAKIQSARLYVEHHEEEGMGAAPIVWEVGGGALKSPGVFGSNTPAVLQGESNEARVKWDVTTWINTAAKVNDLKFVVRNSDREGKKTKIDRVYLVVTYFP
jgi:subtilisin family serine protease